LRPAQHPAEGLADTRKLRAIRLSVRKAGASRRAESAVAGSIARGLTRGRDVASCSIEASP